MVEGVGGWLFVLVVVLVLDLDVVQPYTRRRNDMWGRATGGDSWDD